MRRADRSISVYGWGIVALSLLAVAASMGARTSFGVYVTPWEKSFASTRAEISLISFVSLIIYGLAMPITGKLTDRFGARAVLTWSMVFMGVGLAGGYFAQSLWHLVLLYGVVASVGFGGASPVTVSVAVVSWFRERRGLALGIAQSGIPVGQMVLAPVAIFLVRALDWRLTLLFFGLVYVSALTAVFWAFYRNAPPDPTAQDDKGNGDPRPAGLERSAPVAEVAAGAPSLFASYLALLRQPALWMISLPYFVCGFSDLGLIFTHFVPLAEGRNLSPQIIASFFTLHAAASIGGNLVTGYLADKVRLTVLLSGIYLARGLGLVLLYFAQDPVLLVAFGVANGVVGAATIAPTGALCVRMYGSHQMGTVFGLVSLFHQFGAAAGALFVGLLFTATGSYSSGLVLTMGLLVLASVLALLTRSR